MKPKLLIGLFWGCSLAIAFWFGALFEDPQLKEEASIFPPTPAKRQIEILRQEIAHQKEVNQDLMTEIDRLKWSGGTVGLARIQEGETEPSGRPAGLVTLPVSIGERLRNANGPMDRMTVLMSAFQGMNATNVEEVVAAFNESTEPNRRFSELRLLVHAWSEFDPQGAVEWADNLGGWEERSAISAALERWAATDLDASLVWAREKFKGNDNPYLVGIIGGLTESNPARASELMLEMPYGRNRGRAASVLLDSHWKKGEGEAIGWVEQIKEGSVKEYVTSQLAEKISRDDIGRSARWVESLDQGKSKNRAVGMVAYQWARKDPTSASQWIDGLGETDSRFSGMEGLVKVWVDRDPTATATWLNTHDASQGKDGAVEIFVNAIKRKNPANAMQWAEAMTGDEQRQETIEEVERIWRRGDPETYQAWKESRSPANE